MPQSVGNLATYPARTSAVWYIGLILVGGGLLSRPFAWSAEEPISLLDALFTATSAACVTGLAVRSTGHEFSLWGQMIILGLIQLGGIGIMTVTTYVTFQLGGRMGLRERAIVTETLGGEHGADLRWVLRNVLWLTLWIELGGFLILAARLAQDFPLREALWHALFHVISAYCNAGFSLFDDNLIGYQHDVVVNLTITTLIIFGGIGFPVMLDFRRNWDRRGIAFWDHLTLHTKIMLIGTVGLIVLGTVMFLLLEVDGVLAGKPLGEMLLISYFQSVTCRTAGFNTVDINALTNATLFLMVLLMAIGAGPCSTGGGFKVSTFMTLVLRAWSTYRGYHRINVFRRTLPLRNVERATTTALIFIIVATIALTTLLMIEQSGVPHTAGEGSFLEALFEVISALATVGLSTGLTTAVSEWSKVVLIVLMFIGRLGPISLFAALSRSERTRRVEYPHEELLIG